MLFFITTLFKKKHVSAEDKAKDDKNVFYEEIQRARNGCPQNDINIIIGDLNAKGGETQYLPTISIHNLHDSSNDNGTRLKMLL